MTFEVPLESSLIKKYVCRSPAHWWHQPASPQCVIHFSRSELTMGKTSPKTIVFKVSNSWRLLIIWKILSYPRQFPSTNMMFRWFVCCSWVRFILFLFLFSWYFNSIGCELKMGETAKERCLQKYVKSIRLLSKSSYSFLIKIYIYNFTICPVIPKLKLR